MEGHLLDDLKKLYAVPFLHFYEVCSAYKKTERKRKKRFTHKY